MKNVFKCEKCGVEPEELYSFSEYGNNEEKKNDNKEYCEECFGQLDRLYSSQ